jgi:hypothetical protein
MAASRAGDTVSAAIIPFLAGPYPKSPSWHLKTRISSKSMVTPTSPGGTFILPATLKAEAQDILSSAVACFNASAIVGLKLSYGECFLA